MSPRRSSSINHWRKPGQDVYGRVVSSEYDIDSALSAAQARAVPYGTNPSPSPVETPTPPIQESRPTSATRGRVMPERSSEQSPEQFWDEYQFERRILMLAKSLVSQPTHKFCSQIAHLMRHDQKELQRLIQNYMGRRPQVPFRNWRDHDLNTGERWNLD